MLRYLQKDPTNRRKVKTPPLRFGVGPGQYFLFQGRRVQGVRKPPPPPEMTCGFLIQVAFCKTYVVSSGHLPVTPFHSGAPLLKKKILDPPVYLAGLFDTFILLHIWQSCVCFGDILPMRTLCDAYHKKFESHWCSILDVSVEAGVAMIAPFQIRCV